MAETTDAILGYLQGKTPVEIEKTLRNLQALSLAQAEESGVQLARQQADDEKMSLSEVQVKLQKAIADGDLEAVNRWEPLHKQKLQWVTGQVDADEAERVAKINAPALAARQARRDELIGEMNALTTNNVSQNFTRLHEIDKELKGLQ